MAGGAVLTAAGLSCILLSSHRQPVLLRTQLSFDAKSSSPSTSRKKTGRGRAQDGDGSHCHTVAYHTPAARRPQAGVAACIGTTPIRQQHDPFPSGGQLCVLHTACPPVRMSCGGDPVLVHRGGNLHERAR